MACVFSEACHVFASERNNVNTYSEYMTTADILDLLPYSIEEAAHQFGESINDFSFSVVEAIQSAFNDSQCDMQASSLQDHHCFNDLLAAEPNSDSLPTASEANPAVVDKNAPTTKTLPQGEIYTITVRLHEYESWPNSSSKSYPLVEVSPGFMVRLRGYIETKEACKIGKTTTSRCKSCQENLVYVDDAEFVLCQSCRFIGPVQQTIPDFSTPRDAEEFGFGGGLALGLTTNSQVIPPTPLNHKRALTISVEDDCSQPAQKRKTFH